jgi:Tfp pilus assembly protein PilF
VIQELTAAIDSDPTYVPARVARGDVWRRQGRLQQSLDDYRVALTLDPAAVRATLGSAMALVQAKRFADARNLLADAARGLPRSPELAHALVRLLAAAPNDEVRDSRRAMSLVEERVQTEPKTAGLAVAAAMAYAAVMDWDEATAWQRRAIEGARRAGATSATEQLTVVLADYARRTMPPPFAADEDLFVLTSLPVE